MKALVMEQYNELVYKDVPTPQLAANQVLVKVQACSVCGSDVHGLDGSTGRRIPPVIMGHEASGIIEQVGEQVSDFRPGDRVTFDSTIYCNECDSCAAGDVNLCASRRVLGVSCTDYRMNGAFAEYLALPAHVLHRLPDNVSYLQAAMTEPLAIAYHAATRVEIKPGSSVLIVGAGTIGQLILQVVRAMGAELIIAVDLDDGKLAAAGVGGATAVVNSREADAVAQIIALTPGGRGADVAFDATGIQATADICLQAVRLNGQVVLVGNLAANITLPLQWVVTRQLGLHGSCASAGEYDECLRLIAEGKVDVGSMISKAVPLAEGDEWIKRVRDGEPGLNKIALLP